MTERHVGVCELRTRLSEYLRLVKDGNTVIITEHGKPVGRLAPVSPSVEERMRGMIAAGRAEWNGKRLMPIKPVARTKKGYSVAEALIEDRR